MSINLLEFAVFCIEGVAEKLHLPGEEAFDLLTKKTSILYEYVLPSFDVLHTQSKEYVIDDIISFLREEGAVG